MTRSRLPRLLSAAAAAILPLLALLAPAEPAPAQSPPFESRYYHPIDLNRAVRNQYGITAQLTWVGDHAYDWRARVLSFLLPIDMNQAVASQYGSGWTAALVGVHRYDWRAVRISDLRGVVLPVMPVASDRFYDISGVRTGLDRYRSVLVAVRNWYFLRAGGTFRVLQPLVVYSQHTAAQWNQLSANTANSSQRWDLLNAGIAAYGAALPQPGSRLRVVLSPYVGNAPDVYLGAASQGRFALAPQRATSINCPPTGPFDNRCADATYAVGHELGHTWGLGHSCSAYPSNPQCSNSIMQTARPWNAILLQPEIETLLSSGFFIAVSTSFGTGCSGTNGLVSHSVTGAAAIGSTQRFRVENAPPLSPTILVLGWSNTRAGAYTLPLELSSFGAPGCYRYTAAAGTRLVLTGFTGTGSASMTHPSRASLIGLRLYSQFLVVDRGANALGITFSNGVATTLGLR